MLKGLIDWCAILPQQATWSHMFTEVDQVAIVHLYQSSLIGFIYHVHES